MPKNKSITSFRIQDTGYKTKGFTLIELILYVALVGILLTAAAFFATDVVLGSIKGRVRAQVQSEARFALEKMRQEIVKANGLETAVSGATQEPISPWESPSPASLLFSAGDWQATAYVPHESCPDDTASDGEGCVFALEGSNSNGFYQYIIKTKTWSPKIDAPLYTSDGVTLEFVPHNNCPNDPSDGVGCLFAARGVGFPDIFVYYLKTNTWSTKPEFGNRLSGGPFTVGAGGSMVFVPAANCPDTVQDESKGCLFAFRGGGYGTFSLFTIADARWVSRTVYGDTIGEGGTLVYVPPNLSYCTDSLGCIFGLRGNTTPTFKRYDINANSWSPMGGLPIAWASDTSGLVYAGNGRIFALTLEGGVDTWFGCYNIVANACEPLAPVNTWTAGTPPWTTPGVGGALAFVPNGISGCGDSQGCVFARSSFSAKFMRYNVNAENWETLDPGPDGGGPITFDGSAYIYASQGGASELLRCKLEDAVVAGGIDCWESLDNAPQGNTFGSGASLAFIPANICPDDLSEGCIYALQGGSKNVWAYSVSNNDWLEREDAPGGLRKGADFAFVLPSSYCADIKGCLFTFQGESNAFWRYDIAVDNWTTRQNAATIVSSGGLIYNNAGYLYHVGYSNNTIRYTITDDYWSLLANQVPPTRLMWDIDSSQINNITLTSILNFPPGGTIKIDNEYISHIGFSGTTLSGTLERGLLGSTQDSHLANTEVYSLPSTNCTNCLGFIPPGSCPDDSSGCLLFPGEDSAKDLLIYKMSVDAWIRKTDSPEIINSGAFAYDTSANRVFIIRGETTPAGVPTTDFYAYTPSLDVGWSVKAELFSPSNYDYSASIASDGGNYLYVFPSSQDNSNEFWRYAKDTNSWTNALAQPQSVYAGAALVFVLNGTACADFSGCLFAFRDDTSRDFKRYNILENTWTSLMDTPAAPSYGAKLAYVPVENPGCADSAGCLFAFRGGSTAFWRYNISGGTWTTTLAVAPGAVTDGAGLSYDGDNFLYAAQGGSKAFWRYDLTYDCWVKQTAGTGACAPTISALPVSITEGDLVFVPVGDDCSDSTGCVYALAGGRTFWGYKVSANEWARLPYTPDNVGTGAALAYDNDHHLFALRGNAGVGQPNDFYQYDFAATALSATEFACGFVFPSGTHLSFAVNGDGDSASENILQMCAKSGSACGAADSWQDLISPEAEVTNFSCQNISSGTSLGEEAVKIQMTLKNKNPGGKKEFDAEVTLDTSISLRL